MLPGELPMGQTPETEVAAGPTGPTICLFTCDRRPSVEYINESLKSLRDACENFPTEVHIIIDGPEADFLDPCWSQLTNIHVIEKLDWEEIRRWNVHRRIAYSYHRAYTLGLKTNSDLLVCEDDIRFRSNFLAMLGEVVAELETAGKKDGLLTLYSSQDLFNDRSLDRGRLFGWFPPRYFFGGQAVYFPRSILEIADEFWMAAGWKAPETQLRANDLLIGGLGEYLEQCIGDSSGLFRCYIDLVDHVGRESRTGLGQAFHSSSTFLMPWNGSTASLPEIR